MCSMNVYICACRHQIPSVPCWSCVGRARNRCRCAMAPVGSSYRTVTLLSCVQRAKATVSTLVLVNVLERCYLHFPYKPCVMFLYENKMYVSNETIIFIVHINKRTCMT